MRPIQAWLYVDDNTIEHKQPGWVSIYLELGQEWNSKQYHFGHVNYRLMEHHTDDQNIKHNCCLFGRWVFVDYKRYNDGGLMPQPRHRISPDSTRAIKCLVTSRC